MIARLLHWVQKRYERGEFDPRTENSDSFGELPRTYVIRDYLTGDPYLTRTVFPRVLGVRPLLHRFHRPDMDRYLHNHPWTRCLSIVLSGSYDEERRSWNGYRQTEMQRRCVRFWNFISHGDSHRITRLRGEVFTLFLTGKRVSDWGFLTERGYVGHEEYFEKKKLDMRDMHVPESLKKAIRL